MGFDRLAGGYRTLLRGVLTGTWRGLSGRCLVIGLGLASFVGGMGLLTTGRIGVDIFPSGDQSEVDITVVMPSATNIQVTNGVVRISSNACAAIPRFAWSTPTPAADRADLVAGVREVLSVAES